MQIIVDEYHKGSAHKKYVCDLCMCKLYIIYQQIPITLHKEKFYDQEGREILKCGFKIGGGIDQDYKKSPQGFTDYVRINTFV